MRYRNKKHERKFNYTGGLYLCTMAKENTIWLRGVKEMSRFCAGYGFDVCLDAYNYTL